MGIKEVVAAVVEKQTKLGKWQDVHVSANSQHIQMRDLTEGVSKSVVCTVSIDTENQALVEMSIGGRSIDSEHRSRKVAASGWHINTAIDCFYKALLTPELLESKDMPFILNANEKAINELIASLKEAVKGKNIDFSALYDGTTLYEKGLWLVGIYSEITGENKNVFDLVFGKGSFDSFASIIYNKGQAEAA